METWGFKMNQMFSHNRIFKRKRILSFIITALMMVFVAVFAQGVAGIRAAGLYNVAEVVIPISCVIKGDITSKDYVIKVEAVSDDIPQPEAELVSIDGSGKGSFSIEVNEPGTYDYTIYQEAGDSDLITYDSVRYVAHVFVTTDGSNELAYSIVVNYEGSDNKPEEVLFENAIVEPTSEQTTESTTEATTQEEITTEATTENISNETPETSVKSGAKSMSDKKSLKTGDNIKLGIIILVAVGAFLCIVVLLLVKKFRNKDE